MLPNLEFDILIITITYMTRSATSCTSDCKVCFKPGPISKGLQAAMADIWADIRESRNDSMETELVSTPTLLRQEEVDGKCVRRMLFHFSSAF